MSRPGSAVQTGSPVRHEEHRRSAAAGTLASADGPASAAVLRLHQWEHGCGRGRARSTLPRGDPTWSCLQLWAPCFLQGLCGETGPGRHTHEDTTGRKEQGPFLPQEGGEGQRGEQSSNAERPQFEGPGGQAGPGQGSAWNYRSKEALGHCLVRKRSSPTGQHRTAGSAPISATPVTVPRPPRPSSLRCRVARSQPPAPHSLGLLALVVGAPPRVPPGLPLGQGQVGQEGCQRALDLVRLPAQGMLRGAVVGALAVEADVVGWGGTGCRLPGPHRAASSPVVSRPPRPGRALPGASHGQDSPTAPPSIPANTSTAQYGKVNPQSRLPKATQLPRGRSRPDPSNIRGGSMDILGPTFSCLKMHSYCQGSEDAQNGRKCLQTTHLRI